MTGRSKGFCPGSPLLDINMSVCVGYFKSVENNFLLDIVGNAAGSSNGRTADFDSAYLGSNPGPAALPVISNKKGSGAFS